MVLKWLDNNRKREIIFIYILLISFGFAQELLFKGQVLNGITGEPVSFTNIKVVGSNLGTACNDNGDFELKLKRGKYQLEFSAIGFETGFYTVTEKQVITDILIISLKPTIIEFRDEITVYGEKAGDKIDDWLNSTDDIIQKEEGVSMMRRANFALEPSIRGMSAGQIGITVDGMKMFSACVDRMDPITAYVEVENIQKMEIAKGAFDMTHSSSIGGTINLVTKKPDFEKPLIAQTEIGYESVSGLQRFRSELNLADSNWAVRGTFSIKKSNDFYTGNGKRVDNSGYKKNNYKVDLLRKLGSKHLLEFSFIADNAHDIGYPVLLMDATETKSQIYRFQHNWLSPFSRINHFNSIIYFNRVDHWMDDYNRDVTQREVMPDMYMPMFGKTKTFGIREEINYFYKNHLLNLVADFHHLTAFADMEMKSIEPNVSDMYLLNIGDAALNNFSATLEYNWLLSERSRFRSNIRFDFSNRDIQNKDGKRLLTIYWNEGDIQQNYSLYSFSSAYEYAINRSQTVQFSLAQNDRLPTHIENYGYYFYNYTDGYFYIGNPLLKAEHSRQVELRYAFTAVPLKFSVNSYFNDIQNYISGVPESDPLFEEFKIYQNISSAYIAGLELSGDIEFDDYWKLYTSLSYTYGYNRGHDEPLPLIPPLEGNIGLQYDPGNKWFSIDSRFGAAQKRVAGKTTLEDTTGPFFILNVRSRIELMEKVQVKFGVENIFDKKYHEHLSINNLPARGRNLYIGLNFLFSR